jgi:hypothetical protein
MDAGPFGENTTVLMADVAADFAKKPFHIKKYLYGPSRDEYAAEWANLKKTMRGIVLYSSQVVNIAQSSLAERKKPNEVARTLRDIMAQVPDERLTEFHLTRTEVNDIIRNIEIQNNMLDALTQAQNIVDRVANFTDSSFERVDAALNKLLQDINDRMEERWALNRSNVESLYALQGRTFKSYALLYQYREGDPAGLNALRENDPAFQNLLGKDRTPSEKELEMVESQLMARLKNLFSIREQLMPQVEQYLAEARERDEVYNQHREMGKKLRTTVMLWARSHRNLAKGIPVPPEIDLYNIIVGSTTNAAKKLAGMP